MPKIIGGSLVEHREQMRARIFAAFTELLQERGYDAITLADVAATAGLGRTVMYNYYPDKEVLLLAFTASATEDYLQRLTTTLASVANPVDQLRVFIREQAVELATQHVPTSIAGVLSESGRQAILEHVRPLHRLLDEILARAVAERYLPDSDRTLMAQLLTSTLSGRWMHGRHGAALDEAITGATEFILRGLGARFDHSGRPRRLPASTRSTVTLTG